MAKVASMKRSTPTVSNTETEKPAKVTRTSRVLNDVSNRRQTRSLVAKARTGPSKTHVDSSNPDGVRRSPRLSKKRDNNSSIGQDADGEVDKTTAGTRLRKPVAKKGSSATKNTRSSRSRSKSKPQELAAQSGPEEAIEKKSRGRSRTSRKESESTAVEPKQSLTAKRSRTQDTEVDAVSEQPTQKVARGPAKDQPKRRATRSSSRPKDAIAKAKTAPKLLAGEFMQEVNHNLVSLPFDPCRYTDGLSVYDTPNRNDVNEAPGYVTDIFQRLFNAETHTRPHPYMHKQTTLSTTMRAILVDWLVEVHMKFRLVTETLYLCVNILDRYLSLVDVERSRLQLVGVTALFIAAKYEEIYPPEVRDCVYITDRGFTRQEVLDMENSILTKLHFKLSVPTGHPFIKRFLFITNATKTMNYSANYYMERVLQEHEFLTYPPSIVAAAAVCLAINHPGIRENDYLLTTKKPGVPSALIEYTGYSADAILEVAKLMTSKVREEVVTVSRRELLAVKRKFDEPNYDFVSADFDAPELSDITFA